jgi:hypothetical protein
MDKELDISLCKTFPNLYRDRNANPRATCMYQGFPGRGWFLIIWNLSEKLEKMILALPGETRNDEDRDCASQVKEKFGILRFYMTRETDEMYAAISLAERQSSVTCEACGAAGKLRRGGWLKTLCDQCHTEKK